MTETAMQYRERLLVEEFAERTGFTAIAERLDRDIYPPYLYFGFFVFFDVAILNTYKHLTGGTHALLVSPAWIASPVGLILGVIGIRYMADGYAQSIADLRINDRIDESDLKAFERTLPLRTKLLVYLFALAVFFLHTFVNIGLGEIIAYEGIVTTVVAYFFLMPFVYLPLVVEFALTYSSIHFAVPKRIVEADLGLFFYDPRNMGGFASVGQLLKRSYYLYTAGLLVYFFLVYGPYLLSQVGTVPLPKPGLFEAVFFSTAWLVGIVSIAHSMIRLHRVMADEKEQRIQELEDEMRDIIDNPYDINSSKVADADRLDDVRRRLEQVRNTRVYPATFAMWSQRGISVLLPQALQLAIQAPG
ncbi:MAG: hypothetical protein ABEH77_02925 [Halobacteriaceae archaeon]